MFWCSSDKSSCACSCVISVFVFHELVSRRCHMSSSEKKSCSRIRVISAIVLV